MSVVGEELFKDLIEGGVKIVADVVFAMVDAPFDTLNFVVSDFGQGTDELEQLAEGRGAVGLELLVVDRVALVEEVPLELLGSADVCLVVG